MSMIFDIKDKSTWPEFDQTVKLKVVNKDGSQWHDELIGKLKPPNINLHHERIHDPFNMMQFIAATAYFDTDDGLLFIPPLKGSTQQVIWTD